MSDNKKSEKKVVYCKNVNKPGGCSFGKKCKYTHPTKKCSKFNTKDGCSFGEKCTFLHPYKECDKFWTKAGCKFGENCSFSHKKLTKCTVIKKDAKKDPKSNKKHSKKPTVNSKLKNDDDDNTEELIKRLKNMSQEEREKLLDSKIFKDM